MPRPWLGSVPAHIATSPAQLHQEVASATKAEERELEQMLIENEQEELAAE
jgi:hypothetical protein